jgi:hypothetical protein
MQLRGYHLGAAAALETRENADAAAAGVAVDTIPFSIGMLPSPSHCSRSSRGYTRRAAIRPNKHYRTGKTNP